MLELWCSVKTGLKQLPKMQLPLLCWLLLWGSLVPAPQKPTKLHPKAECCCSHSHLYLFVSRFRSPSYQVKYSPGVVGVFFFFKADCGLIYLDSPSEAAFLLATLLAETDITYCVTPTNLDHGVWETLSLGDPPVVLCGHRKLKSKNSRLREQSRRDACSVLCAGITARLLPGCRSDLHSTSSETGPENNPFLSPQ